MSNLRLQFYSYLFTHIYIYISRVFHSILVLMICILILLFILVVLFLCTNNKIIISIATYLFQSFIDLVKHWYEYIGEVLRDRDQSHLWIQYRTQNHTACFRFCNRLIYYGGSLDIAEENKSLPLNQQTNPHSNYLTYPEPLEIRWIVEYITQAIL